MVECFSQSTTGKRSCEEEMQSKILLLQLLIQYLTELFILVLFALQYQRRAVTKLH